MEMWEQEEQLRRMEVSLHQMWNIVQRLKLQNNHVHDWKRESDGMKCAVCGVKGIRRVPNVKKKVHFDTALLSAKNVG